MSLLQGMTMQCLILAMRRQPLQLLVNGASGVPALPIVDLIQLENEPEHVTLNTVLA